MAVQRATLTSSHLDHATEHLSVALAMGVPAPAKRPESATIIELELVEHPFAKKGEASAVEFIRPAQRTALLPAPAVDGAVFYSKGEATAEQFITLPLTPVGGAATPRTRLWLRVAPEQRARVKHAATQLGQSAQAFMRDAVDAFLAHPLLVGPNKTRRDSSRWLHQGGIATPRVKLAISIDAERGEAMRLEATRLGQTLQWCLSQALTRHLQATGLTLSAGAAADRRIQLVHDIGGGEAELPLVLPSAPLSRTMFCGFAAG
jgi:hypothetical protein